MLREALVGLGAAAHYLFLAALETHADALLSALLRAVVASEGHHVGPVADAERVLRGERRLGERQEIDGVEQVGLALAVVANEAVDAVAKVEFGRGNVAVIEYGKVI